MSILTSTDWVRYESRPGGAFIKSSVTGSKAPVATVFVLGDTFMVAPYLSLSPGPVSGGGGGGGGGGVTAAYLTASCVVFRCLSAGPYDTSLRRRVRVTAPSLPFLADTCPRIFGLSTPRVVDAPLRTLVFVPTSLARLLAECVQCCRASTDSVSTVRDGEPRVATPTFTQPTPRVLNTPSL